MSTCLICLLGIPSRSTEPSYHEACLTSLFGFSRVPEVRFGRVAIPQKVAETSGKMSISGMQPKAVVQLAEDGSQLTIVESGGGFILKPQQANYANVPENEHLTMSIAALVGIEVPPFGILRLADDSIAYIVRRFDRVVGVPHGKVHMLDFCQLLDRPSSQKGSGSAEECASTFRARVREDRSEVEAFFVRFLFSYWIGNGDMHLKNLAVLEHSSGYRLAPAYDLVNTHIYNDKTQTLSLGGKIKDLRRVQFLSFGREACGLDSGSVEGIIEKMLAHRAAAEDLVRASLLPEGTRAIYLRMLAKRSRALGFPTSSDAEEE